MTTTAVLFTVIFFAAVSFAVAIEPPREWIDPDTGHRVVRLTTEPNSASLYFHQHAYLPDGKRMIYTTPAGVSVLNLETRESKQVVVGDVKVIVTGLKTGDVYYTKDGAVHAANVDTAISRKIANLPKRGGISTVNCDETLLAGTYIENDGQDYNQKKDTKGPQELDRPVGKAQMMEDRLAARLPMAMFTIDTRTGETKVIHRATDWLNHLQFSPTDPKLLMFCHEGPWHKVDRLWTIRIGENTPTKIHHRTMIMEIFGHEFWSADGKTIWYDLQTPRGEDFWLAGYELSTGRRTWYHLQRNEWSIHFNVNKDGTLFCGDGGDKGQVARSTDGKWIYLFKPELTENRAGIDDPTFVRPGVLRATKLVNMSKHDYKLEPNVTFTPDQKWVVFRSNMFGDTYTFAVEIEPAK